VELSSGDARHLAPRSLGAIVPVNTLLYRACKNSVIPFLVRGWTALGFSVSEGILKIEEVTPQMNTLPK